MNADFEDTAQNHGPAFATFAYTLLEDILANTANPARMNRTLVEQLRELTGARLVILARRRELAGSHELAAVEPERRSPLAELPAMMALAGRTRDLAGPTLWERGKAPLEAGALRKEGLPGPAVAVPLRVGKEHVGALLLFGLPHTHSLDQVIDALDTLSRVVALVFRNAALYEDQEAAIAARTRELAEEHERLAVTLRSIGDAVIAIGVKGRITFINPVAEQLTGWREAEATGKPLDEVFRILNEQTRRPVENPVARVLREGVVVGLANHTLLIAKDGTEIPIADSGAPMRNAQGEITGVVLVFRDQTNERAAQNALRQSEAQFRSVFERSPVGIGVADEQGNLVLFNEAMLKPGGYSAEDIRKLGNVAALYHNPEQRAEALKRFQSQGFLNDFPVQFKRKDGSPYDALLSLAPINFMGQPRVQAIVQDITDRVRAEEELVQRQRRLSVLNQVGRDLAGTLELARIYRIAYKYVAQLVDCPAFGISLYDPPTRTLRAEFMLDEGELLDATQFPPLVMDVEPTQGRARAIVTRQPEIITDYPAAIEKATGASVRVSVSEEERDTGSAMYVPMVARGQVMGLLEVQSYQLDAYSAKHAALLGPVANQIGLSIQSARLYEEAQRELVERKQAEAALRQSERALKARNQIAGVLLAAPDDAMHRRILQVVLETLKSPQGVFGYLTPDDSWDYVQQPDGEEASLRRAWGELWERALAEKTAGYSNTPPPAPQETVPMLRALAAPIVYQEEVIGNFLVVNKAADYTARNRDILEAIAAYIAPVLQARLQRDKTEQKRRELEAQYYQAQKIESIGQLTAGIAHDFNNMLTPINGFAELIQMRVAPDSPIHQLAANILQSARSAASLIRQLMIFSRMQVIQPVVLNLNDVLVKVEAMLRRTIGEDIALKIDGASDLWPVEVDPTQLEQVLVNLAVNARDAMPRGGELSIKAANVTLDEEYAARFLDANAGQYVSLSITDTGVGMSREVQEHVFEPFFTTKEHGKGTGLGLATVYGIVKQNNGHIEVQSQEGRGSTFTVYLPRIEEPAPESPPQQEPPAGRAPSCGQTVLVVEDDPAIRGLVHDVLVEEGYVTLAAEDGPEALRIAESHSGPLHLLLTDVVMPGMSGKELADRLAQTHRGLKVIFMSGYADEVISRHDVLAAGVSLMPKPFRVTDMVRKVRQALD